MNLESIKTFLLDGDGVLWHGSQPVPGLKRFIDALERRGIGWGLLTNNATRSPEYLVDKLKGFGVIADAKSVFTSALATAQYLKLIISPGETVYVVGESGIQQSLTAAGYAVDTSLDKTISAQAVVVCLDRQFTYQKLDKAMQLIRGGAIFIATNPDLTFPAPDGLLPGAGAIVAAVAAASDVQPIMIGKPGALLYEVALSGLGASISTTAMIGDRLETDILGAQQIGLGSILVLSGISKRADIDRLGIHPDLIFDDITAIVEEMDKSPVK